VNGNAVAASRNSSHVVSGMLVPVAAFRPGQLLRVAVERLRNDARESIEIHEDGSEPYMP